MKIGGITMSIESKTYRLFKGKMQANELYFANKKLYEFLCIHTVEVTRSFFAREIKELQI